MYLEDKIENKLIEILSDNLGLSEEEIKANKLIKDYSTDSLTFLELIYSIEDEFKLERNSFDSEDILAVFCNPKAYISDFLNVIKSYLPKE